MKVPVCSEARGHVTSHIDSVCVATTSKFDYALRAALVEQSSRAHRECTGASVERSARWAPGHPDTFLMAPTLHHRTSAVGIEGVCG